MFGLPEAKRVCRGDLRSPASSRASSPDLPDSYAIDALRSVFSLDTFTAPEDTPDRNLEHTNNDESAEQEFEFRLFRAPAPKDAGSANQNQSEANAGVQKLRVRLRSPTPVPSGDGGFVTPFRGWDYYLSDPEAVMRVLNGKSEDKDGVQVVGPGKSRLRNEFVDAAVSGETVFAWAKTSWPGCQLPWRVIHLRSSSAQQSSSKKSNPAALVSETDPTEKKKKKCKPGKKRRIILRKRAESKKADEEAEKEKRNKRNREKKIKRRQRERDKKAALRETEGTVSNGTNAGEGGTIGSGIGPD